MIFIIIIIVIIIIIIVIGGGPRAPRPGRTGAAGCGGFVPRCAEYGFLGFRVQGLRLRTCKLKSGAEFVRASLRPLEAARLPGLGGAPRRLGAPRRGPDAANDVITIISVTASLIVDTINIPTIIIIIHFYDVHYYYHY